MSVAEELIAPSYKSGKPETMLALADIFGADKALRDGKKNEARKQPGQRHQRKVGGDPKGSARKIVKRKAE